MSLLLGSTTNTFLRDSWGFDTFLPDYIDPSECAPDEAVPRNRRDLANWLTVIRNPASNDKRRPYLVVHQAQSLDQVLEVSLRLQGFLASEHTLSPLGTWDGTAMKAIMASQRMALHGGPNATAWTDTLQQLNNIIAVIWSSIDAPPGTEPRLLKVDADTALSLQRRVFVKRTTAPGEPTRSLPIEAAPYVDALRKISNRWELSRPLPIGTWDGEVLQRTGHAALSAGDFVDVMVSIEIVYKSDEPRVYFNLERIIQVAERGILLATVCGGLMSCCMLTFGRPPLQQPPGPQGVDISKRSADDIFA